MSDREAQIKVAIDGRDIDRARALIRDALRDSPTAELYYLAAQVALSEDQKRDFLNRATALDPFHEAAFAELERLQNGSLKEAQSQPLSAAPTRPIQPGTLEPVSPPATAPLPVAPPIYPTAPAPKRGGGAGLIIGLGLLVLLGVLIMNMMGFFGGKAAFAGTWDGTLTGESIRCSDGSTGLGKPTSSSIIVRARQDNAIEWYASGWGCTIVMDVNGNTATQRSGTSCRGSSGGSTFAVGDMLFVLNGNALDASYTVATRAGDVTCTLTTSGTLARQRS